MMFRFVKWTVLILFLFILEFSRVMDAIDSIFTHKKHGFQKVNKGKKRFYC